MEFTGFCPQTVDLMWGLRLNNNKEWFLAHKPQYETLLHQPMKALGQQLLDAFAQARPDRCWRLHLSRIYRDARRLYGRGPMNDHLWLTVYADAEKESAVPAFYFSIHPEGYSYGLGCWTANHRLMNAFRRQAAQNPAPAEKLASAFARQEVFALEGELYCRPKQPSSPTLAPWVNRKAIHFDHSRPHGEAGFGPGLYDAMWEGFLYLMPYFDYFDALARQA